MKLDLRIKNASENYTQICQREQTLLDVLGSTRTQKRDVLRKIVSLLHLKGATKGEINLFLEDVAKDERLNRRLSRLVHLKDQKIAEDLRLTAETLSGADELSPSARDILHVR